MGYSKIREGDGQAWCYTEQNRIKILVSERAPLRFLTAAHYLDSQSQKALLSLLQARPATDTPSPDEEESDHEALVAYARKAIAFDDLQV